MRLPRSHVFRHVFRHVFGARPGCSRHATKPSIARSFCKAGQGRLGRLYARATRPRTGLRDDSARSRLGNAPGPVSAHGPYRSLWKVRRGRQAGSRYGRSAATRATYMPALATSKEGVEQWGSTGASFFWEGGNVGRWDEAYGECTGMVKTDKTAPVAMAGAHSLRV